MTTVALKDQQLFLSGKVDFANAQKIYAQGIDLLQKQKNWPIQVNLSELQQGGTLVLAILLQWLRSCPDLDSLKLSAVPDKMQDIIRASNLQQLVISSQ